MTILTNISGGALLEPQVTLLNIPNPGSSTIQPDLIDPRTLDICNGRGWGRGVVYRSSMTMSVLAPYNHITMRVMALLYRSYLTRDEICTQ